MLMIDDQHNSGVTREIINEGIWSHTYHVWIFINNEDHKNHNLSVPEHKQQALNDKYRTP
jgi:hypothetical protein